MLYREYAQGRIAITQPTHAWVSGQLARAWGNERFGVVTPWEEVCLGAEQHDVGHTLWEQEPTLNPQTGLPYSFLDMPRQVHIQLWSSAGRLALAQGRYAALLVSLHGTGLYERYDLSRDTTEEVRVVQDYLVRERAFQQELLTSLRADPHYGPFATDEMVERNRQLVRTWDALSLAICFGQHTGSVQRVPMDTGTTSLTLTAHADDCTQLLVAPWPFHQSQITLIYEGRYVAEVFSDEATMRTAFKRAPWITLTTTLLAE
ncbi:MAG: DUF3891 family protein [Chloroflexi bacterium]|nr:DUF3891 family protein [Chloroflexota bacterium]